MMRRLETQRLSLEPLLAAHAPAMFAVLGDPAIYTYENAPPASVEALRARYAKLESRQSADGREQWLNWILRQRAGGELIGYVQASVHADGQAYIAYELASAFWRRGLGSEAVAAMIAELRAQYRVQLLLAVFKRANLRSRRLLEGLGFTAPNGADTQRFTVEPDEDLLQCRLGITLQAR